MSTTRSGADCDNYKLVSCLPPPLPPHPSILFSSLSLLITVMSFVVCDDEVSVFCVEHNLCVSAIIAIYINRKSDDSAHIVCTILYHYNGLYVCNINYKIKF